MFNGAQFHLILNHLPIIGFVIFVPVIVLASLSKRTDYQRMALLAAVFLGLLVLPAYWTGEPAEETLEQYADAAEAQIEEHEESAEVALVASLATSGIAALAWFLSRKRENTLLMATRVTALAVIVTSGLMAWVGHEGGKISHPELEPGAKTAGGEVIKQTKQLQSQGTEEDD